MEIPLPGPDLGEPSKSRLDDQRATTTDYLQKTCGGEDRILVRGRWGDATVGGNEAATRCSAKTGSASTATCRAAAWSSSSSTGSTSIPTDGGSTRRRDGRRAHSPMPVAPGVGVRLLARIADRLA